MGAKSRWGMVEAIVLVAVLMGTAYLVGAVASGAVQAWWHTTVGGM